MLNGKGLKALALVVLVLCAVLSVMAYAGNCTDWTDWETMYTYCSNDSCPVSGFNHYGSRYKFQQRQKACYVGNQLVIELQHRNVFVDCCPPQN